MHKNELVQNLPHTKVKEEICEACELGKQSRKSFPKHKAWRAEMLLQLVHTDVCRPMKTESLNGSRYYTLFIDDFNRFCWMYFMKQKSEVANIFGTWKKLVENQCEKKVKMVRSDNGTKYTCDKFKEFCVDAGIEHQYTTVYTPQQNSVSERKNRTIMEMARCLLFDKKLPKIF